MTEQDDMNDATMGGKPPLMPPLSGEPPLMPPVSSPVQFGQGDAMMVSQDDKTMGMMVHLLALLTGILGSLILWLVKKDESRFVDFHGKEAVNFQLTMMMYAMILVAFGFITMGFGFFIAVPLLVVIGVCGMVFEIMACLAATRGEWHRYPMTIRFIQ